MKAHRIDLVMQSYCTHEIMINLSQKSCENILNGEKTVIVQRRCPEYCYGRINDGQITFPKFVAYIFNKNLGVVGKSVISLLDRKVYYLDCGYDYKHNPQKYKKDIQKLNETVDLTGTCLSIDEFRRMIGIGKHYYFAIHEFTKFDPPLPIEDFWIARSGKNGGFAPSERFKYPRTWCYALKKSDIEDMEKELS